MGWIWRKGGTLVLVNHASMRRQRRSQSRRRGLHQEQPSLATRYTRTYGGHHPSNQSSITSTMHHSLTTTCAIPISPSYARRMKPSIPTNTLKPGQLLNMVSRSNDYALIEGGNTWIRISWPTFKPREPNVASPHMTPLSTMGLLKPLIVAFSSMFMLCSIKVDFPNFCGGKPCYTQTGSRTERQHVHSIT